MKGNTNILYLPNGLRYPLVGGTRQRHFDGTSFKPRKVPKNAQTPTTMVSVPFRGSGAYLSRCSSGRCVRRTFEVRECFSFYLVAHRNARAPLRIPCACSTIG